MLPRRLFPFLVALSRLLFSSVLVFWLERLAIGLVGRIFGLGLLFSNHRRC